jgi:hypothetical protein
MQDPMFTGLPAMLQNLPFMEYCRGRAAAALNRYNAAWIWKLPATTLSGVTGCFRLKGANKMKRVLGIAFAVLAMAAIAFGADNTLGTWKYNAGKSKPAPGLPPITSLTVTREAADGGAKISAKAERADGSKIDNTYTVKYDGKEVAVPGEGPWDTTAIKQVNANTLTEERSKKGGKYHSTVRFVVSADGKTMTATSKGTGADGEAFTAVAVWDKQ